MRQKRFLVVLVAIAMLASMLTVTGIAQAEPLYWQDFDEETVGDVDSGYENFNIPALAGASVMIDEDNADNKYLAIGKTGDGTFIVKQNISSYIGASKYYTYSFRIKADFTGSANIALGSVFQFVYSSASESYEFLYHDGAFTNTGKYFDLSDWTNMSIVVKNKSRADIYIEDKLVFSDLVQRSGYSFDELQIILNNGMRNNIYIDEIEIRNIDVGHSSYTESFDGAQEGTKVTALDYLWEISGKTATSPYDVIEEENGNKYAYVSTVTETANPTSDATIYLSYNHSTFIPDNTDKITINFNYMPIWGGGHVIGISDGVDGTLRYNSTNKALGYHNGTGWTENFFAVETGQWYNLNMIIDQTAGNEKWSLDINGTRVLTDIPVRSDKPYKKWIRFMQHQNVGGFGIDNFNVYSGDETIPLSIKTLNFDTMPTGSKLGAYGFAKNNQSAGNVTSVPESGKFGKSANDSGLAIVSDTTSVGTANVDAYINIQDTANQYLKVREGEEFSYSMNFAFDEKLTAPIMVNGRAYTYYNGSYNNAKIGGETGKGYFLQIYPDRIKIWGESFFYFDVACDAEKWYNIKVVTKAGSIDGSVSNTFSAYLDDIVLCENKPIVSDLQLRFDGTSDPKFATNTWASGCPVFGFSQIWLNYNLKTVHSGGSTLDSYPAGKMYFDNVELTKYINGAEYNHNAVKVSHIDPANEKNRIGMVSYLKPNETVSALKEDLQTQNVYKLTVRDSLGAEASDLSLAGGKYYEAISTAGTKLYGKLSALNQSLYSYSGGIKDEWKSFDRSERLTFNGLGGKDSSNESFGIKGPFSAYELTGNYNDFLFYDLSAADKAKLNAPFTIETSLYISGNISTELVARGYQNNVDKQIQYAWINSGKISAYNTSGTRTVVGTYEDNQWIRISATFYPGKNIADIYLNGRLVMESSYLNNNILAYLSQLRYSAAVSGPMDENTFIALDDINLNIGRYQSVDYSGVEAAGAIIDYAKNRIILPEDADTSIVSILDYIIINAPTMNIYTDNTLTEVAGSLEDRPVLFLTNGLIYNYYRVYLGEPYEKGIYYTVSGNKVYIDAELDDIKEAVLIAASYDGDGALIGIEQFTEVSSLKISAQYTVPANAASVKLMCISGWGNIKPLMEYEDVTLN